MIPSPIPTFNHLERVIALVVAAIAVLTPYAARAIAIPMRGAEWFTAYTPSIPAVAIAVLANCIHGGALYALVASQTYRPAAAWLSVVVSLTYVAIVHFAY